MHPQKSDVWSALLLIVDALIVITIFLYILAVQKLPNAQFLRAQRAFQDKSFSCFKIRYLRRSLAMAASQYRRWCHATARRELNLGFQIAYQWHLIGD